MYLEKKSSKAAHQKGGLSKDTFCNKQGDALARRCLSKIGQQMKRTFVSALPLPEGILWPWLNSGKERAGVKRKTIEPHKQHPHHAGTTKTKNYINNLIHLLCK